MLILPAYPFNFALILGASLHSSTGTSRRKQGSAVQVYSYAGAYVHVCMCMCVCKCCVCVCVFELVCTCARVHACVPLALLMFSFHRSKLLIQQLTKGTARHTHQCHYLKHASSASLARQPIPIIITSCANSMLFLPFHPTPPPAIRPAAAASNAEAVGRE